MQIWIDFINTPQVSFWVPFIRDLEKEGYDFLLTCRDSGNTVDLLKQQNFSFKIIGDKAGKGFKQKGFFFIYRFLKLYWFIKHKEPVIAASQSSFYQPIVARLLGIPCLYTNDNEHAKGNFFGFVFATKVLLPIALKDHKLKNNFFLSKKLSFYPSVKEGIYLSAQNDLLQLAFTSDYPKDTIYFRPEPRTAQYYSGPMNFFDEIIIRLGIKNKVIILPRDKVQAEYYGNKKFEGIEVASKPIPLKDVVANCKLFIGAGGSMTRELAVLGIKVVSIYNDDLLCVDKYLIEKGKLFVNPKITFEELNHLMEDKLNLTMDRSELENGFKSYQIIKQTLILLNNGKN